MGALVPRDAKVLNIRVPSCGKGARVWLRAHSFPNSWPAQWPGVSLLLALDLPVLIFSWVGSDKSVRCYKAQCDRSVTRLKRKAWLCWLWPRQTHPQEALELHSGLLTMLSPSMHRAMPVPHTPQSSPGAFFPTSGVSRGICSPRHTHLDLAPASGHSQVGHCPGKHLLVLRGVPEPTPRAPGTSCIPACLSGLGWWA